MAETKWLPLEQALQALVDEYFPAPRPEMFEIHATGIRNGEGYFRGFPVGHRIAFRDACLRAAATHEVRLIYRAIAKQRFRSWVLDTFGPRVAINPHVAQ